MSNNDVNVAGHVNANVKIAVIGLGYVGLPLAIALARHFQVIGFDINETRLQELRDGHDRTHEIDKETLKNSSLTYTHESQNIRGQDIYIVTVPTPVTEKNLPDLTPLQKASETVGKIIERGAIVVYESTVYPGVTEDFCGPILEKMSGLKAGQDFFLGYSPERINPGDKEHTVDRITKVVSGQTTEVAQMLKQVYGTINNDNIFIAKNIKTAEAAKVIENTQRDINIAFINEIATIVGKLGVSIYDVLEAAETKWNFLKFKPGLVGGHCIGVDPYYLAHCSRQLDHEPEVLLAGRRTNENMGPYLAERVHEELKYVMGQALMGQEVMSQQRVVGQSSGGNVSNARNDMDQYIMGRMATHPARILVLGVTFKEDIPDLRNTKVIDVIRALQGYGHTVDVHDPHAHPEEAQAHLDLELLGNLESAGEYDCIIGAVPHRDYLAFSEVVFQRLLRPEGLVADFKNMWRDVELPVGVRYWSI